MIETVTLQIAGRSREEIHDQAHRRLDLYFGNATGWQVEGIDVEETGGILDSWIATDQQPALAGTVTATRDTENTDG